MTTKIISVILVIATLLSVCAVTVSAANGEEFVSEVALVYEDSIEDAKKAIAGTDWKLWEQDLNPKADYMFDDGVYLIYKTSTNVEDAITDLRVMDMYGGYNTANYEKQLEASRESYMKLVSYIRTAQGSQLIGISGYVFRGKEVDVLPGHTQLGIQPLIEVTDEMTAAAVGAVPGGNLALLVGVLIQEEDMYVAAADLVLIQVFHHADKHRIFGAGQDHHQLLVAHIGHADLMEQVDGELIVHIGYDLQLKLGIFKMLALLRIDVRIDHPFQHLGVHMGQPLCGSKLKLIDKSHYLPPKITKRSNRRRW